MRWNGQNKETRIITLVAIFLVIEALDEIIGGVMGAAYPSIRTDLHLSYLQIGLLLAIPNTISSFIEPILGVLGDLGQRRSLIVGGGISFAIALLLIPLSHDFWTLLLAFVVLYPASGAFVSLSQATLMDLEPTRHEQNMARWVLAGSVGDMLGSLVLAGAIALGQNWRSVFLGLAGLTLVFVSLMWRHPLARTTSPTLTDSSTPVLQKGIDQVIHALKRRHVLRWLSLLQVSDLMLDGLRGFIAFYFVDVVGTGTTQASFAFTVWVGCGLLGDALLIPLLERVRGVQYLRLSAFLVLCLYPLFLATPTTTAKIAILGGLGFLNAGWYSILQGRLYTAMPGQSGTVMTLSNLAGLVGGLMPLALGWLAQQYGLQPTMWLFLAAPIVLLIGLYSVE